MITLIRAKEQAVKSKEAFQGKEDACVIWQYFVVLWQNEELCCTHCAFMWC